jgi:hypothetical protein
MSEDFRELAASSGMTSVARTVLTSGAKNSSVAQTHPVVWARVPPVIANSSGYFVKTVFVVITSVRDVKGTLLGD